ncbi:MAG: hypothetical protein AAF550_00345 [Myxococcota bacterium]
MTKRLRILVPLLLLPSLALGASTWSAFGYVSTVSAQDGRYVVLTDIPTSGVCGDSGKFYWTTSNAQSGDFLRLATAAMLGARRIRVLYDGADLDCWTGAAKISGVKIGP